MLAQSLLEKFNDRCVSTHTLWVFNFQLHIVDVTACRTRWLTCPRVNAGSRRQIKAAVVQP